MPQVISIMKVQLELKKPTLLWPKVYKYIKIDRDHFSHDHLIKHCVCVHVCI